MGKPRNKRVIIYRGDSFYITQVTKTNLNHYYEVWRLWDGVYRRRFKAKIYFDKKTLNLMFDIYDKFKTGFTVKAKLILVNENKCVCLNKGDTVYRDQRGIIETLFIESTAELHSGLKSRLFSHEEEKGLENNINDASQQSNN